MIQKKIFQTLLLVLLITPIASVQAVGTVNQSTDPSANINNTVTTPQTTRQQTKNQIEPQKGETTAKREAVISQRCQLVESRVQLKVVRYEALTERHHTFNTKFYNRISRLTEKMKTAGYDTTKLTTDLAALKTKIDKFSADKLAYISALKATQQYSCAKSQDEFTQKLNETRQLLLTLQNNRIDIRTYYLSTIKPDILALKNQKNTTHEKPTIPNQNTSTATDANNQPVNNQ